jgi:hypothetical protein
MGIQFFNQIDVEDQLMIEVGRRLQLTQTEQKSNRERYESLSAFIDGPSSVLEDKVKQIDPSGSNSIGASIRSINGNTIPDIDAVIELNIGFNSDPESVLDAVKKAICRGGDDDYETYRGCEVEVNSRCVTVTYKDGVEVDLMPVALFQPDEFAPVMVLFHHRVNDDGTVVSYTKKISPLGFKNAVNSKLQSEDNTVLSETLAKAMSLQELLAEKAEVTPYPDTKSYEHMSPRIVAIQLLKRFRDVRYSMTSRSDMRKPPSVVISAMAIEASFLRTGSLFDEVIHVASSIRNTMKQHRQLGRVIDVRNPGYDGDVFTDRWPERLNSQTMFENDLDYLLSELDSLKQTESVVERKRILKALFGEALGSESLKAVMERKEGARQAGQLHVTPSGGTVIGALASAGKSTNTAVSSSARFGGDSTKGD